MKRVKRLFACVLALTMMFGLSATAFAAAGDTETTPEYTDYTEVTIHKVYKLTGAGSSPAETFTLEQVGNGEVKDGDATSAPALGTITGAKFAEGAATANGATADITVALPSYDKVGVYEYTLREVDNGTAGVTYRNDNIKLVVTVVEENGLKCIAAVHTEAADGTKSDTFENTYSAGTLKVSKTVTGNLGDKSKYFEFKVTLTGVTGKTYGESYAVSGGSSEANNPTSIKIGEETTFKLKHDDTISIANLPYGVSYTVVETAAKGYTTTKTGYTGSINAASQTAAFTNEKKGEVDTGVYLSNLPYILIFAGVLAIAAVFVVRRRRFED